jgi:hypothetical protein
MAGRSIGKIDEEQVLPHPPLRWPGLDPREVDPMLCKYPEDLVQETGLVFLGIDEDAALGAALLTPTRPRDPDEPGGIARVVLDIVPEDGEIIEIGRHPGYNSSRPGSMGKFPGTCRIAAGMDDRDLQFIGDPAALFMGLGMGIDHGDKVKRGEPSQVVVDRHIEFSSDKDPVLEQSVKRCSNPSRLAVLDRDQPITKPFLDPGKDLVDGRGKEDPPAIYPDREFMGEGPFRPQHEKSHRFTIALIR